MKLVYNVKDRPAFGRLEMCIRDRVLFRERLRLRALYGRGLAECSQFSPFLLFYSL